MKNNIIIGGRNVGKTQRLYKEARKANGIIIRKGGIDMPKKAPKRKKLTENIIEDILSGKLAIMIFAQVDEQSKPIQLVFPGKATLHRCWPNRNSYFTVVNAADKFYFKEYDYFWFVVKNEPPKDDEKETA